MYELYISQIYELSLFYENIFTNICNYFIANYI